MPQIFPVVISGTANWLRSHSDRLKKFVADLQVEAQVAGIDLDVESVVHFPLPHQPGWVGAYVRVECIHFSRAIYCEFGPEGQFLTASEVSLPLLAILNDMGMDRTGKSIL